jgi:beta-lactamase regulating signal transducer with metallopeptidase domain
MNASGMETLNALTGHWASAMMRGCLQGGAALLLVWLVTRVWKRLAPELQCWLWRVAYMKLLIAAVGVAPVALPLLPERGREQRPIADRGAWTVEPGPRTKVDAVPIPPAVYGLASTAHAPRSAIDRRVWLLVPWAAGVLACGFALGRGIARGRRLRRAGRPIGDGEVRASYESLARRLGLSRPPAFLAVRRLTAPVLLGVRSPAILVPSSLASGGDTPELSLALAHELGHQRRRDLLWNWLPVAARLPFFFHPLVWLAEREWRLAQEMACDTLALRATAAPVARYAGFLVTLAARGPEVSFGGTAVGVLDSPGTLARRLNAMKHLHQRRNPSRALAALMGGLAIVGLVPWQLTARAAEKPPAAPRKTHPPAYAGVIEFPWDTRDLRLPDARGFAGAPSRLLPGPPVSRLAPGPWSAEERSKEWLAGPQRSVSSKSAAFSRVLASTNKAAPKSAAARLSARDGSYLSGEALLLLPFPSVEDELRLTGEQRRQLRAAGTAWGRRTKRIGRLTQSEQERIRREAESQFRTRVCAVLTPAHRRRLYQIELQVQDGDAFAREDVGAWLGLTLEQTRQIRSILDRFEERGRLLARQIEEKVPGRLNEFRAEQVRAYEAALGVLHPGQRVRWRQLIGASFHLHAITVPARLLKPALGTPPSDRSVPPARGGTPTGALPPGVRRAAAAAAGAPVDERRVTGDGPSLLSFPAVRSDRKARLTLSPGTKCELQTLLGEVIAPAGVDLESIVADTMWFDAGRRIVHAEGQVILTWKNGFQYRGHQVRAILEGSEQELWRRVRIEALPVAATDGLPREEAFEKILLQRVDASDLYRLMAQEKAIPMGVTGILAYPRDQSLLVRGTPAAIATLGRAVRVADVRVETVPGGRTRVLLTLQRAKADTLRAEALRLSDAGTATLRGSALELEGSRAWLERAIGVAMRAEMAAP